MKKSRIQVLFVVVFVVAALVCFVSCATQRPLRDLLDSIPEKHIEFYSFDPTSPLYDRIADPPESLLDLWRYSEEDKRLKAYTPSPAERDAIIHTLRDLPLRHRQVLTQRLVGIYCVENFAGRGMADYILGPGDDVYAYLLLNSEVFDINATELITTRALSAFRDDGSGSSLEVSIIDGDTMDVSGLFYILLHETSHIVDYVERHTPYVEHAMYELYGSSDRDSTFSDELWVSYSEPKPHAAFPGREELRFYGLGDAPNLTKSDMHTLYRHLAETGFPSLYGSTIWAEDFADYVTFYYLVHTLGAEYRVSVSDAESNEFIYEPMKNALVIDRARSLDPELFERSEP